MNRQRITVLVAVVAIAAILGLGWLGLVKPQFDSASASNAQRQQVEDQNAAEQAKIVQLKADYDKLPEFQAALSNLSAIIPSSSGADVAGNTAFLEEIYACASNSHTKAGTASFSEAAAYAAAPGTLANGNAGGSLPGPQPDAALAAHLFVVTVKLTEDGSLQGLASYLRCIQGAPRLMLINSVNFSGESNASLTLTVQGSIYIDSVPLSGDGSVPAPKPSSTGTPAPGATPVPGGTGTANAPTGTPEPVTNP